MHNHMLILWGAYSSLKKKASEFLSIPGNVLDIRKGKAEDKGSVGQVLIYKRIIVLSLLSVNVHVLLY